MYTLPSFSRASAATAQAQDAVKIGAVIGKLKFTDIRLLPRTLEDFGKKKAYVLVFTNTSCPLVTRYLPTLQGLAKEYPDVQFVGVNSAEEDSVVAMATQAVRFEVDFPFVKDFEGVFAKALGVRRTPEAVNDSRTQPTAWCGSPALCKRTAWRAGLTFACPPM